MPSLQIESRVQVKVKYSAFHSNHDYVLYFANLICVSRTSFCKNNIEFVILEEMILVGSFLVRITPNLDSQLTCLKTIYSN